MNAVSSVYVAATMRDAVLAFLAVLGPEQRARAVKDFASPRRLDWHYVPREREGLPLKQMTSDQKSAALALLRAGLSEKGYSKAETIRQLETVLRELEGRAYRDPDLYYFTIFGDPSTGEPWGWRYEGHHLSQNWTIVGERALATSPQFFGANPGEVRTGPLRGARPLAAEEDLARALVRSLDGSQAKAAIVGKIAPRDIISAAVRRAELLEDRGVAYQSLHESQANALSVLVEEHASALSPVLARERMARLRGAGMGLVKFAWMGGLEKGQGHYYRIQGPTFLVEYDNTQNEANHVHTVWRDFDGDFGLDLLEDHYRRSQH
jgi:hypothetical protein